MDRGEARRLIAEQLCVPVERVTDAASFARDLGADSLDLVELSMSLEERFDVAISDDEAHSCNCVGDALRMLAAKLELGHAV